MNNNKQVTIVIPVYKDWDSLEKCLLSCDRFIDNSHQILIINDASPEQHIERHILAFINQKNKFQYHKNLTNLGFVRTCNKGVFELANKGSDILLLNSDTEVTEGFLEEMLFCLYHFEKNAVCCPRSNNATLLTVPVIRGKNHIFNAKESHQCWEKIRCLLPRYTVIPTGVGFCMLIKRPIIDNFGLFDEIYGKGYNEENDFCCRINQYGYSTVMSNNSFVFHHETRSFTPQEKNTLNETNSKILIQRYPEYTRRLEAYFAWNLGGIDHFASLLSPSNRKQRILINLIRLHPIYNGTSEHVLALCNELQPILAQNFDCHIAINTAANEYFGIDTKFDNVIINDDFQLENQYDLIYTPYQIYDLNDLFMVNRSAIKFVVGMLDIIAIRCNYLHFSNVEAVFENAIKYADGIIANSRNVIRDIESYFSASPHQPSQTRIPIYLAKDISALDQNLSELERNIFQDLPEKFILVFGNKYRHKSLDITLSNMPSECAVVVFGADKTGPINNVPQHFGLQSGSFSDGFINKLVRTCRAVVFPSQYEGFGLPILSAIAFQKPLVIFDSEVSREITKQFGVEQMVNFFSQFRELRTLIQTIKEDVHYPLITRSWRNNAMETATVLEAILNKPIDIAAVTDRYQKLLQMEYVFKYGGHIAQVHAHKSKYWLLDEVILALRLLRREGGRSFLYRLFWYMRGKRLVTEIPSHSQHKPK